MVKLVLIGYILILLGGSNTFLFPCETIHSQETSKPTSKTVAYEKAKPDPHKDKKLPVDSSCIPTPDLLNGDTVYRFVEKMPEFKGGQNELMKYITNKLNLGKDDECPPSKIIVTCVIDTAGNVVNPCIQRQMKSEGLTDLEKSAITAFREMPPWQPGQQNGKKVNVRMNFPIRIHYR